MDGWLGYVLFAVIWIVLQVWVLPRAGVPT